MPVELGIAPCACDHKTPLFRCANGSLICSYCGGVQRVHRDSFPAGRHSEGETEKRLATIEATLRDAHRSLGGY